MNPSFQAAPMGRREAIRTALLLALGGCALRVKGEAAPATAENPIPVHDPSTAIFSDGTYWIFSTGKGIRTHFSRDFLHWEEGPAVFATPPAWTLPAVPGFKDYFWAPEIIKLNGLFHLYYAISTFRSQISAIGLATNPTLDPKSPAYRWTDCGPIIQSSNGCGFNTIDPALIRDENDKLWMAFGSFWNGIMLVQLDRQTGRKPVDSTVRAIAYHASIEAPYLYRRGKYFYLFVNWGFCCRGVNSTYNIRVGRSRDISGSYTDQKGIEMPKGGGTLLLETSGTQIGPGQPGISTVEGTEWLTYHFYDGTRNGKSMLGQRRLHWTDDGWPSLSS